MYKRIFLMIVLLIVAVNYSSAQKISPDSAKYYEDSVVTVCGKVEGTHVTKAGGVMLNIGATYPNAPFVVVIFKDDVAKFKYKPADFLKGKNICVAGKIVIFKDKPEIIAKNPNQIKVE
ncbi:MAG: hypothetical protein SGJ10_07715 [Bacteroidota bacterium]|nr:hypothetical protein [Bacteroidota bacterium]